MANTVYISPDVNVAIGVQEPLSIGVSENETLDADISSISVRYGDLPKGGNLNDVLVKQSGKDYDAVWRAFEELNFRHIYYDSTAHWDLQPDLISEAGALYVYSDHNVIDGVAVAGIRIGDGKSYLIDLPFVDDAVSNTLLAHINNTVIHVTAEEKEYWNNKVTAILGENPEELVLTKQNV